MESRAGTWSSAAERAVTRVAETAAGGLDVRLRSFAFGSLVVSQGIDARQAGARRQKHGQEE
jgi:hypothetical protein